MAPSRASGGGYERGHVHDRPSFLHDLTRGAPALLVVAHPDDETLGLGGHLARFPALTIVHLTDGAPRDPRFAHARGFESREAYAAARRDELERALAIAGARPSRSLGLPDQDAALHLVAIVRALRELCRAIAPRVVLTHAYEGGHPDHDAAAFAVHALDRALAPCIVEMPFYHLDAGTLRRGLFVDGARGDEVRLDERALATKRAMLACFESQRDVLEPFDPRVERFRVAARPDFSRPPHEGPLYYETLGWPLSGERFRALASRALRELAV